MTDTSFEELFAEAEANVKKQEIPDEWGSRRDTEEGERLLARFIGRDELPPFNDVVFRFVSYPGEPQPLLAAGTTGVQLSAQRLDHQHQRTWVAVVRNDVTG